jgi:hypothetical protein
VLNKIDLEPDPVFGVTDDRIAAVFPISCATGAGIEDLRKALFTLVPEPPVVVGDLAEPADYLVYRPQPKKRTWSLLRVEGGFRVVGTPPSEDELERALREAGAKRGVSVELGDESFEFVP